MSNSYGKFRQFIDRNHSFVLWTFSLISVCSALNVYRKHKNNTLEKLLIEDVKSGMVYKKGMQEFLDDIKDLKEWLSQKYKDFNSLKNKDNKD
ncbi:uncharacterized protein LOC101240139 isoform X3 [Hydra vulgaris]|uniref:uncharacterized protein LOC101240139 isoform X3 n=1 Tax=Hydra vulgaris TaxID=6087 RepID=UPI0001924C6F